MYGTHLLLENDEINLIAPSINELRFGDMICVWSTRLNEIGWIECRQTAYLRDIKNGTGVMGKVNVKYGFAAYSTINPTVYIGRFFNNETFELMSFTARRFSGLEVQSNWADSHHRNQMVWIPLRSTNIDHLFNRNCCFVNCCSMQSLIVVDH